VPQQQEKFTAHLPAVLGATAATVAATLGTSFLGYAGTLIGVVAGSLIIGGGSWWAERAIRGSTARARALAEARRRKGRELSPEETHFIAAVADERHKRANRGVPWALAGMSAGVVLLAATAVILFIELGTGKPVSAVVQGHRAHGLLAPVAPSPEPSFTRSARPSPSPSLTPSLSPSTTLPVSPGSPSATTAPAATTAPPSASPSPSPAPDFSPRGGNASSLPGTAPSA
jgi:hypothetical protein